MSYINDALRKAQAERNGKYLEYIPLITTNKRGGPHIKPSVLIFSGVIFCFCAVGVAILLITQRASSTTHAFDLLSGDTKTVKTVMVPLVQPKEDLKEVHSPEALVAQKDEPIKHDNVSLSVRNQAPNPVELKNLYKEAVFLQRQNQFDAAEKKYLHLIDRNPTHSRALNNLGVIYLSQKRFLKAMDLFERAIRTDKNYVEPLYNIACLYAQLKDEQQSISYLRKAIMINRDVRRWVKEDKDFKDLRDSKEFNLIVEDRET